MHNYQELDNLWKSILPEGCFVETRFISDYTDEIHHEERLYIAERSSLKQHEYSTSRSIIRQLLSYSGPVLTGSDGQPLWPEGMNGSITHCRGICTVAAHKSSNAIGVDLEQFERVKPSLWNKLTSKEELKNIIELAKSLKISPTQLMAITFSAKEAFFKFQFGETRDWLGFQDVEISINPENSSYTFSSDKTDAVDNHIGRYTFWQDHVLTCSQVC